MKKLFIFLIFVFVFNIYLVNAISFSPSYLIFNQSVGEKTCQTISFSSDSKTLTVLDLWANESFKQWNVNFFNDSAQSHGLALSYPKSVKSNDKSLEVCLRGSNIGEYHGVVLIREVQVGNSITRAGVWLKVVINESVKKDRGFGITGAVVDVVKGSFNIILIVIVVAVIAGIIFFIKKKRRDPWDFN